MTYLQATADAAEAKEAMVWMPKLAAMAKKAKSKQEAKAWKQAAMATANASCERAEHARRVLKRTQDSKKRQAWGLAEQAWESVAKMCGGEPG